MSSVQFPENFLESATSNLTLFTLSFYIVKSPLVIIPCLENIFFRISVGFKHTLFRSFHKNFKQNFYG